MLIKSYQNHPVISNKILSDSVELKHIPDHQGQVPTNQGPGLSTGPIARLNPSLERWRI